MLLPLARLGGRELPCPLGILDLESVTGRASDAARWRAAPHFLFFRQQSLRLPPESPTSAGARRR